MRYLKQRKLEESRFAYIWLNARNIVHCIGGDTGYFGLTSMDVGSPALDHAEYLAGLLSDDNTPVVIENTQYVNDLYVNIHLFHSIEGQWIVFLDNTEAGGTDQAKQQKRLDKDILIEYNKRQL